MGARSAPVRSALQKLAKAGKVAHRCAETIESHRVTLPDDIREAALAFSDAFGDAVDVGGIRTRPEGYAALAMPHAPVVSASGLPPYDGVHRASYVECGVCVRLRLAHARVSSELATALRAAYPELVGTDGDLYEYEREARSQYVNRARAMARLGERVRACGFAIAPATAR